LKKIILKPIAHVDKNHIPNFSTRKAFNIFESAEKSAMPQKYKGNLFSA